MKVKSIGKFIPILFLSIFLLLFLSACNKNQLEPIVCFYSKFCFSNQGTFIEGNLNIEKDGTIKLEITAPDQIKGLNFLKSNNETTINFKDLTMKSCDNIFPESSFIRSIFDILDNIKLKNNYNLTSKDESTSFFVGKCNNLDFEFKTDNEKGFIKEIKIPKENFTLSLYEHKNKT